MTAASTTWSQVSAGLFATTQSVLQSANGEAPNSDDGVNDAKDLKPHSRCSRAGHRHEQKDDTRRKVNNVVRRIDVENVEQHSIRRRGRDETENSNDQEDETEDNCECSNHSDLLLVEEIALMVDRLGAGKRKRAGFIHNVRAAFCV
jgi:hypothetical protein